jgi:GGDEF domain-containing protein
MRRMTSRKRYRPRLKKHLDDHNASSGKPYELSISVGMVQIDPESDLSVAEIIKLADAAMYKDKRAKNAARA